MIYFDNAATSYPKPYEVAESMFYAMKKYGANPGRGGYKMSDETSEQVYLTRKKLADLFGAKGPEYVILTQNCTSALNIAIKGFAKRNGNAVTSCFEHNSVMRPLYKLSTEKNHSFKIADYFSDDRKTIGSFENSIDDYTDLIVCTAVSNVFGEIMPYHEIGNIAKKYNLPFILDGAQAAGVYDIDVVRDNISCLCIPGHKGLYGPTGTGALILNDDYMLDTVFEGGTGSESGNFAQPSLLPDRYESGTINTVGIIGLGKGIDFVKKRGISNIRNHEASMISYIYNTLKNYDNIILYNDYNSGKYAPVLSFNVKGKTSEETAYILGEKGVAVRGGYHCNMNAHKFHGTDNIGTVRISVSYFNSKNEADFFIKLLNKIDKM